MVTTFQYITRILTLPLIGRIPPRGSNNTAGNIGITIPSPNRSINTVKNIGSIENFLVSIVITSIIIIQTSHTPFSNYINFAILSSCIVVVAKACIAFDISLIAVD